MMFIPLLKVVTADFNADPYILTYRWKGDIIEKLLSLGNDSTISLYKMWQPVQEEQLSNFYRLRFRIWQTYIHVYCTTFDCSSLPCNL